eukprot:TRINITY_DN1727_c1_g2_i5.p1 TRINITY_DN1727_c1_g2~~TRINITY_DN1727_c1_g2_i5.p1  ORF type:complete len:228 (-),score=-15.71 TRINITY_DN1727_c1_g2_i5:148-831(-)
MYYLSNLFTFRLRILLQNKKMICKGVVVLQKTLLSRFYKCLSVQFGKARNPFVLQCLFIFYSQTFMKIKKCLKNYSQTFCRFQVFWLDSQTFVTSIKVQQNFPSQTFLMSTVVFIINDFQKVQIRVFIFILPTHQVSIKFHILVENFHKIWVEFSFVSYAFRQYCWIWGFVQSLFKVEFRQIGETSPKIKAMVQIFHTMSINRSFEIRNRVLVGQCFQHLTTGLVKK